MRRGVGLLAWLCAVIAASLVCAELATAASFSAKTVTKCQKLVNKSAQKLMKAKLAATLRCAGSLVDCQLAEEIDGDDFSQCAAGATASCEKQLGKITSARDKLTSLGEKGCTDLKGFDLVSRRAIGYRDAADSCAALVPPATITDLAGVDDCVARTALCRGDDAAEAAVPRAFEVLDRAGVVAANAELFPCLDGPVALPPAPASTSKALGACQRALTKAGEKKAKALQKGLYKCADGLLGCQLRADRLEADLARTAACLAKASTKCTKGFTKIDKATTKGAEAVLGACGGLPVGDVLESLGFDGPCAAAANAADIEACAAAALDAAVEATVGVVEPRTCTLLSANLSMPGFDGVCVPSCGNALVDAGEVCDDGNADDFDSCRNDCTDGPTDFTVEEIASSATPAETPDGTVGTAVDPGSTLATQFGSTVFDLNKAWYTRYFLPGAGDPDAVLVLVPGFAGGSGSFRYLAENLLVRAQAAGNVVLEVWAFDRRTNQLEDDAGAVLADDEHDGLLALDWYFGAEIGLALDPRLSRRAVFHEGSDVAFIANFTPHVFARDIDAVVEAALALPSSPVVFLGGHSLGTTFTARYAATDFDPGAGVAPGHAKLAGLVLLEGGGDSVSASPPSDDELDRIIAKADGGLFHAVRDGAARCVDGTPCSTACVGGADDGQPCNPASAFACDDPGECLGVDADCSGVTLPPGALTNKCVLSVEAYTGADLNAAFVLVTPQVHAAGDIAGIQGKLDPDGLSLVAQDFGAGTAVENVPGVGLLDLLPPASVEASVGFFLDDEFSPQPAFRASLGYSNNGFNQMIFGAVLPHEANPPDPYRLWIDVLDPELSTPAVAAIATANNGVAPLTVSSAWGQEKEVTRVDVLFSFLRSGARNFGDSYFASSGLGTTAELSGGTIFGGGLDSTELSVTRGRPDIENLTEAAGIDIPVICFGGTNGLTPTEGSFLGFANSIGTCTAASCTGSDPRVVSAANPVQPTYGDVAGGYEVHLSEGYAHIDIVSAEDDGDNNVIVPLLAFIERNTP